jgi:hypothetical protein
VRQVQLGREFLYPRFDLGQPEGVALNDQLGLLQLEVAARSSAAEVPQFGVGHLEL